MQKFTSKKWEITGPWARKQHGNYRNSVNHSEGMNTAPQCLAANREWEFLRVY